MNDEHDDKFVWKDGDIVIKKPRKKGMFGEGAEQYYLRNQKE